MFPVAKKARTEGEGQVTEGREIITVQDAASKREKENYYVHGGYKWPKNPTDATRWFYPVPWIKMRWQNMGPEAVAALWTSEVHTYFKKEGADIPIGQDPKLQSLLSIAKAFLRTIPPAGDVEADPLSMLLKETLES